jgi:hypothetical protein
MFASSRDELIPRTTATIEADRVIMTLFFSGLDLITFEALPPGTRLNQEYFIDEIQAGIVNERPQILRRIQRGTFYVQMDNSMCYNGQIVTDELVIKILECVPHSVYCPDLSLCDFWLFGMLKQKITDRVIRPPEKSLTMIRRIWDKVVLEQLQSVFSNWIERFGYVSAHEGEYYAKSH